MTDLTLKKHTSLSSEEVVTRAVQFFANSKWRPTTQSSRAATFEGRPPIPWFLLLLTVLGFMACLLPGIIMYVMAIKKMRRFQNLVVTATPAPAVRGGGRHVPEAGQTTCRTVCEPTADLTRMTQPTSSVLCIDARRRPSFMRATIHTTLPARPGHSSSLPDIVPKGDLETHGVLTASVRVVTVPVLNALPGPVIKKMMQRTSCDASTVVAKGGSTHALEAMYTRYERRLFLRGLLQGVADAFWHHVVSQPKALRNRLRIVRQLVEAETIAAIHKRERQNCSQPVRILSVAGGQPERSFRPRWT